VNECHTDVAVGDGVARLQFELLSKQGDCPACLTQLQRNDRADFKQGGVAGLAVQQLFRKVACLLQLFLLVELDHLLHPIGRCGGNLLAAVLHAAAAFVLFAAAAGAGCIFRGKLLRMGWHVVQDGRFD